MSPSNWHNRWHHQWHHLSIRNRVLLATIVPVLYLFCSVVGYSYQSRQAETHAELNERAHIVATALAESLAANVVNRNIAGLYQSMNALVQSDRSIQRIAVFDAQHQEMTHVTSLAANQAQESFVEMPIQKKLIWVSLLPQGGQEGQTSATATRKAEVGFVRVTMSPT
ncbi:MAG: hypothetical protein HYZ45_06530, partial [Burkholderiales bacterium]|nr:hypothetical protein [Burkholderiales bacterium]